MDSYFDSRLVFLALVVVAGIAWIWFLDVDHVPKYLFEQAVRGRLWHSPLIFGVLALVGALGFVTFVVRRSTLTNVI